MSELTPYLCVRDSRAAIEWYAAALGAEVTFEPIVMDDGRVGHCELAVDGARWMMSDEFASAGVAPPDPARGACVTMHLTVADCDAAADRVRQHGVRLDRGPRGQPAGRPGGGLPRPVRAPVVPQPAAGWRLISAVAVSAPRAPLIAMVAEIVVAPPPTVTVDWPASTKKYAEESSAAAKSMAQSS
jgi:PhnB protein